MVCTGDNSGECEMTGYDEQFNLRKRHPMGRVFMLLNEVKSLQARLTLKKSLNVSYGESDGQRVDIFPACREGAPVFVFIHGGYFRALDKRQYSYLARPLVKSGCTVVLVNYDLAPTVRVKEIVDQNLRAFSWIRRHIDRWNGDPDNLVISGHSVGAFLVAKILECQWDDEARKAIRGAIMLSGLYDLLPVRQSYLNRTLQLSEEDARMLSPMFGKTRVCPPTMVAVGEGETQEFIDQSQRYSDKLNAEGHAHRFVLLRRKNHYTVARLLSGRRNGLMREILGMCGKPEC